VNPNEVVPKRIERDHVRVIVVNFGSRAPARASSPLVPLNRRLVLRPALLIGCPCQRRELDMGEQLDDAQSYLNPPMLLRVEIVRDWSRQQLADAHQPEPRRIHQQVAQLPFLNGSARRPAAWGSKAERMPPLDCSACGPLASPQHLPASFAAP